MTSGNIILEITPTNVTYSKNGSPVYKTSLLDKGRLRKSLLHIDYQGFYNKAGGYRATDVMNGVIIPPASCVYYGIYAETLEIPSPKHVTDTYLKKFCCNTENGFFQFKQGILSERHPQFTYEQACIHICRKYDLFTKRLFLLAGLAKRHLDCDIMYSYTNEVINHVDILIAYDSWAFLIVFSERPNVTQEYVKKLYEQYNGVSVVTVNPKKIKKENINGVYFFTDESDEYIFQKTKEARAVRQDDDGIYNSYLDYDLRPFYIAGIDEDFF